MNDEEFDQVPQRLFDGVNSLVKCGTPGALIPVTNDTRAVLSCEKLLDVMLVAVRYGQGRCLVFGHTGYIKLFTKTKEYKDQGIFVDNCNQWVSNGSSNEILKICDEKTMDDLATEGKILLWDGHDSKDDAFIDSLCEYLQSGGALICAATAWGWLQRNSGKDLSSFPFSRFCDRIGVKLMKNTVDATDPIEFRPDLVEFQNACRTIERLEENPDDTALCCTVGLILGKTGELLPGVNVETLKKVIMNADHHSIPMKNAPVEDKECLERCRALCNIMRVLPGIKAPGIEHFPGDFNQPPWMENKVSFTAKSTVDEWHCTGYYVAAGVPVQIEVVQQEGATGWSARVGCHDDRLKSREKLCRWPLICISKRLTDGTITIDSAFGGLLFLESPEEGSSSITVNIDNVVRAPTYNLLDCNRAESWEDMQTNAQGLWADLAGEYIVFNLPSSSVLDLDSTLLDRVLKYWDSVVLVHHDLLGTKPTYRERIVCDEQTSAGYMHSGYPVVTHLDIADPQSKKFVLDLERLQKEGFWGLFHELGHNRQRNWWTFEGTGEVTVNIFTLHALDKICHLKPWLHSWLEEEIPDAYEYIDEGCKFEEWQDKPGVALFIYAQLVREYGWDSYKAVFRTYEETKPELDSTEEKIDHWITTFSRQVDYNLVPLFKFWGFPVSQSVVDSLADLEIPSISDVLIDRAPARYNLSVE